MAARPIVIAYDISKNKTRNRVFKILREWRLDGQKSVHECRLDRQKAEELFIQLGSSIDTETDNLLMAWISTRRKILTRGCGRGDVLLKNLVHLK